MMLERMGQTGERLTTFMSDSVACALVNNPELFWTGIERLENMGQHGARLTTKEEKEEKVQEQEEEERKTKEEEKDQEVKVLFPKRSQMQASCSHSTQRRFTFTKAHFICCLYLKID
jgi:hypothetical protein